METVDFLVLAGLIVLAAWSGDRPPRYREIAGRGRMWGDAEREQDAHLDHFFPPTEDGR